MSTRDQLALALPLRTPLLRRRDFVVSESNAAAIALAEAWLASPDEDRLVICGPKASGKTHLAHILAEASPAGAQFLTGATVGEAAQTVAPRSLIVVDDADGCDDPHKLLTLVEDARAGGAKIVLVGPLAPADWAKGLPDLRTRIEAMPRICLSEPDEALLCAVMQKLFRDRQLRVDPDVTASAAVRLPRTFAAASAFVEAADRKAAEKQRAITRNLAHDVIRELF